MKVSKMILALILLLGFTACIKNSSNKDEMGVENLEMYNLMDEQFFNVRLNDTDVTSILTSGENQKRNLNLKNIYVSGETTKEEVKRNNEKSFHERAYSGILVYSESRRFVDFEREAAFLVYDVTYVDEKSEILFEGNKYIPVSPALI